MQNKWDQAEVFARRAGRTLNNKVDQAILAEYSNATQFISAGDMGGSGTGSFVPSTANIAQLFTVASRKLNDYDVGQSERFAVIGGRLQEYLRLYVAGRETAFGDQVGANGYVGSRFGFDIYYSNNLYFTASYTPANTPTAAQTFGIAGVTFTWQTTIGATAGNVLAETDVATSVRHAVSAINNSAESGDASGTDWVPLSKKNQWRLLKAGVAATDSTTKVDIVAYGDIVLATSDSNDPWSVQVSYPLFGIKGSTDLVLQKAPNVVFKEVSNKLGRNVFVWQMYGKKTFTEAKDGLVYAKIDASSWA